MGDEYYKESRIALSDYELKEWSSLHNHSDRSVMDGLSSPEDMILKAKEKGITSIAITDHGHMHAVSDFYIHGKKHGVKAILGMEAYAIDDIAQWTKDREAYADDKDRVKKDETVDEDATNLAGDMEGRRKSLYRKGHLVMLAQNKKGLENLFNISHLAHKEGFYMKPRVDKKMVDSMSEGIICSSACMGGVVANKCWAFKNGDAEWKEVVAEAESWREILKDRFFLELQFNEHDSQRFINDCILKVHKETGIPLTVTGDAHYINPDEWEAQELLYLLRSQKTMMTKGDKWDFQVKQLYIKSAQEMWETYEKFGGTADAKLVRQAFENTLLIDSMIDSFEPDIHQRLPSLADPNPFKKLGEMSITRLKELNLHTNKEYCERLMHELKLIKDKGFANYFIIMRDIIWKAKEQMLVGPGRGSAAGSLVCYLNGITNLDPITHGLLFERFINPDRIELPDIDTDFQDTDVARELLREMFGEDNVACISTYNTFNIKGLLKDVGRVFDIDHREINIANKKIEAEMKVLYKGQDKSTIVITLESIEGCSPTYRDLVNTYPQIGKHMRMLYGKNRHIGRHACGVVIGDNLPREMPVFKTKGILQTSYTMGIINKNVETMGFVKFDLLGLSTLNVIDHALKLIEERTEFSYAEALEMIDPLHMDLDDPRVLKTVFEEGSFTGIFQFTSSGIRKLAMKIKPDCFNDVSAVCALYRPGPLGSGMDKLYADYKHNPETIEYMHPLMEDILRETHGCLVYQEQMLRTGMLVGKLSLKDTNRLRKLLLKKDKSKKDDYLEKEKKYLLDEFVKGCVENGMTKAKGVELWGMLEKFGGYGFNAAHAKAYTLVTMQTAWLRTYYPLEYFCAVLTHGKADEFQSYVDDIKRQGFNILPIDINKSREAHIIEGDSIRLAFNSASGVGDKAALKIVKFRPYTNFRDFLYRHGGNKTATVPLIKVGAFKSLEDNVAILEQRYDLFISNPKMKLKKNRDEFERQYFDIKDIPEHPMAKLVEYENELLGFSLSGSPFEILGRDIKIKELTDVGMLTDYESFIKSEAVVAVIPVIVKNINERAQRNGRMFAFMKFGDKNGSEFEAPAFANIWKWIKPKAAKGNVYLLTVNRKIDEDRRSLLVGKPGFAHTQYSSQGYLINVDDFDE